MVAAQYAPDGSEVISVLLEAGSNVNHQAKVSRFFILCWLRSIAKFAYYYCSKLGVTAIYCAAYEGKYETTKKLLMAGADPEIAKTVNHILLHLIWKQFSLSLFAWCIGCQ